MGQYIDFKAIAETVGVEQVAQHLNLPLKKSGNEFRCVCPVCETDDERSLAVYPQSASFRCYAAGQSGDCIALYAHIQGVGMYAAAKKVQEMFGIANASRSPTQPQKPQARTEKSQPAAAFDPLKFAAKLSFSEEVAALGLSEADANRLGVGWHPQRKRVYWPIRNPDGSISGFITADGVKLPPAWIGTNVVQLRRA